ncbi:MAG: bifunctional riboflavin kinase/FAD synthetase [Proteobacteria bacterium]|nr:bifunctional riboflavin kinase/FAD synthetase [Pseudomonadota bacterium]
MIVIRKLSQIKARPALAITIGNFDGIHLGHSKIVDEVKNFAKEKNLLSTILTFEPHPTSFFKNDRSKDFRITSLSQKLKIFREKEIDRVIILPFNHEIASIEADYFIEQILVKALNIKCLLVGYDFIFGKNRQGNFALLEQASKKFGFELHQVPALKEEDQICSSSLIRQFVSQGNIAEANKFLGRNFSICGIVNEGKKLANQLGFPTANLMAKPHIIKPKFGVYKTSTFIPALGKKFSSITNFGVKPTINCDSAPIFETHILNFSSNIYGKKIEVEFLDFIREERKFSSLDQLKEQIKKDLEELHIL